MQEYTVFKKFTAQDQATVPFNANKNYTFDSSASIDLNGIKYFAAQWTSESVSLYSSASATYGGDTINLIKYYQIDHLFYRGRGPYEHQRRDITRRFGEFHYVNQKRTLYDRVNIISIPVGHYGHSIKKGTFKIEDTVKKVILVDDSKGNLIVKDTDVSNYNIDIKHFFNTIYLLS